MALRSIRKLPAWLAGAALVLGLSVPAAAGTPVPEVPKAKAPAGDNLCVEPVDVMRKDHMNFILHQRDRTVHEGIRTKQHSLNECIACHVTPDANGDYPRYGSADHFCSSCHSYAAVKIDCFECHADRPTAAPPPTPPHRFGVAGGALQWSPDMVRAMATTKETP